MFTRKLTAGTRTFECNILCINYCLIRRFSTSLAVSPDGAVTMLQKYPLSPVRQPFSCFDRRSVRSKLIDLGVIVGPDDQVNPKSLGYRTCTYVGIKLEKGSMYKSVVAELQKIPEIVECHFTTGPYTMLTKLYACDNEHLMDLLNNKMQEIPGVVATETLISLEQSIKKEIPIRVEK